MYYRLTDYYYGGVLPPLTMSRLICLGFVTDNDGSDPRICGGDWGCRVQKHEPIWGSRTYKNNIALSAVQGHRPLVRGNIAGTLHNSFMNSQFNAGSTIASFSNVALQ